jgi:hypothetical protein
MEKNALNEKQKDRANALAVVSAMRNVSISAVIISPEYDEYNENTLFLFI